MKKFDQGTLHHSVTPVSSVQQGVLDHVSFSWKLPEEKDGLMRTSHILFCLLAVMAMAAGGLFLNLPAFGKDAPAADTSAGMRPVLHEKDVAEKKTSDIPDAGKTGPPEGAGNPLSSAQKIRLKPSYKPRLVWQADDCGCTPIQPERQQGLTKITYGFYHQDMETQENEAKTIAVAKIKFSRLNRIGYASLVYDTEKGFLNYEDWENNGFVKDARRYNTRVDLVVAFQKNPVDLFSNKSRTRTLARDIERLIKDHGGGGVTIDFRNTADLDAEIVHGFVSVLSERLTKIDKQLYLNLFFEFNEAAKGREFNTLSLYQVGNMAEVIDLLLVMLPPGNGQGKASDIVDRFLTLSDRLDLYGIQTNNNGLKDKTLPVFFKDNEKNEIFFNQILSVGYGGIGLWPEQSLADQETQFISYVFKNHPLPAQMDYIKKILHEFCPDCCKWICPNRRLLIVITQMLGAALLLYYFLWLFFCEIRSFSSRYALYVLGICLVFLGLVACLILCVPSWQGKRTMAMVLLVLGGLGYGIKEFIRKRQEAKFP